MINAKFNYLGEFEMRLTNRLLLLAALFALAIPLIFAGTASATYMSDGATPNGVTGGWNTPTDFVCIVGLHSDGTLDIADGVTDRHTCQYLTKGTMNGGTPFDLSTMTSSNDCTKVGTGANDGAKHAWATSICIDADGNGLSLAGLDRTQKMCEGIGGTWVTSGVCTAYNAQFKGQDATGTPLAFGTKGTVQGAGTGYCYASMNFTAETSPNYTSSTCPSSKATTAPYDANAAYDWSWTSSQCRYAKGIAGKLSSALTKADGTTYAAGAYIDLSTFATMGECLANGGSWANWTGQAPSISSVTGTDTNQYKRPVWDYTRQAPDADTGCLHCHSTAAQYNGPAERWKDSYLKTGHKNMLRKVTPGQKWADPDGVVYTTDGTNTINFMTSSDPYGKITVAGVDQNLYYIYGDWMAPLPSVIYGKTGYGTAPNGTTADNNGYSCAACHTTGYRDNSNIGVLSIGNTTGGYAGVQPQESFPNLNVNSANPTWDIDGITCGRCHNAAVGPINSTMIAASAFPTTHTTGGGMGSLAAGTGRTNLCFGCHGGGSMAKVWPAGTNQYDPTLVATGVSHGAAAGRDFNGHILGQAFLNSPHALYAGVNSNAANGGSIVNSLGKNDLFDPEGTTEYGSTFQGYTCWQSSSSSSPAKTKADGSEIKDKATCEGLYGAGAWRSDTQGTCVTCHDVHNSLFVADQEEAAIRKTCENCHVDNSTVGATDAGAPQVVPGLIAHTKAAGTPFDSAMYESSCVVCHMATQALANGDQNSLAVHEWRINTDPNYNTFPTVGQFYGGACSVHTGAVQNAPYLPVVYLSDISSANCTAAAGTWSAVTKDRNAQIAADGAYANAVWVDLDLACSQCHGGSFGAGNTHNGAPYYSKLKLAEYALGIHNNDPLNGNFSLSYGSDNATASVSAFASGVTCDYNWGDGSSHGTNCTDTHTYATGGEKLITLTVTSGADEGARAHVFTAVKATPPTASAVETWTGGTWTEKLVDTSAAVAPNTLSSVSVAWGDGISTTQAPGTTFTHTYTRAGTFTVTQTAKDNTGQKGTATYIVAASNPVIAGNVYKHASTTGISGAYVFVTRTVGSSTYTYYAVTNSAGHYQFSTLGSGAYSDLRVTKAGYTFPTIANPATDGSNNNFTAN
jgi:hypothetical protein